MGSVSPIREVDSTDDSLLSASMMSRLSRLRIMARKMNVNARRGQRRQRRRGAGTDVIDKRSYTLGDDPRRIDWAAYARSERLMVRVTADETPHRIVVIVDNSLSMGFRSLPHLPTKLVMATQIAAGLAVVALGNEDRVGVLSVSDHVGTALPARRSELSSVLSTLTNIQPEGTTDLSLCVRTVGAVAGGRGLAVLISDTMAPDLGIMHTARALRLLGHRVAIVEVLDPFEVDPPDLSGHELQCMETGALLGLGKKGVREAYQEALLSHRKEVDQAAVQLGAPVLRTATDEPFESVVLAAVRSGLLRRGGSR